MLASLALIVCLGTLPESPTKSWDMPDRERAAIRFNAGASAVRRARAIAEGRHSGNDDSFFVFGRHNPELLMPAELMGMLIVVYDDGSEVGRKFHNLWRQPGVDRFGPDFWVRLRKVAAPLIEYETEQWRKAREHSKRDAAAEPEAQDEQAPGFTMCRLRAEFLGAARSEFGREHFDAFLYEVVAPEAGVVEVSSSDPASLADDAMWQEGGCQ